MELMHVGMIDIIMSMDDSQGTDVMEAWACSLQNGSKCQW